MKIKSLPAQGIKAGTQDGLDEGQFEAIVSVFGNKDSYGDVVLKGAFTDTLAEWKASGDPIPVLWSHRMDDPDYNIGHVLEAKETDQGLWIRAQLDLDSPKGAQVYRLMKGRRVTQFSFSYEVTEGAYVKSEDLGNYYELRRLKLYEVGPTPIGANQETELLDVKAFEQRVLALVGAKAGRVLSAKNEDALRSALSKIADGVGDVEAVLSALDPQGEDGKSTTSSDSKATPSEPAKSAQDEEPMRPSAVDLSALQSIELAAIAASV